MDQQKWDLLTERLNRLDRSIEHLDSNVEKCGREITEVKVELATLKGKNAAWASIIAVVFSAFVGWLFRD